MNGILHVTGIVALGEHRLRLQFSDGSVGEHDFTELVGKAGPMVEPLREADYFARVFLEDGALTWPNSFDLDPTALHMRMADAGELQGRSAAE